MWRLLLHIMKLCVQFIEVGVWWSLKAIRLACCFVPECCLEGYNRTRGRASWGFIELYCPLWCEEYRRSVICVSVLFRFWMLNIQVKSSGRYFSSFDGFVVSREKSTIYSRVDTCQPLVFWRFANSFLLWSLHFLRRWTSPWWRINSIICFRMWLAVFASRVR